MAEHDYITAVHPELRRLLLALIGAVQDIHTSSGLGPSAERIAATERLVFEHMPFLEAAKARLEYEQQLSQRLK